MTRGVLILLAIALLASLAVPGYAADKEAIKIELPEPSFMGTPLPYWSPQLEPEDYRDRPDYLAPKGTVVVSKGKAVTSSWKDPLIGTLKQLTDGDKDFGAPSLIELGAGVQWVQIDLEKGCDIYAIVVWHYHENKRVYFDIVAKAGNDQDFKDGVVTLYNNDHDNSAGLGVGKDKEYIENYKGRLIKAAAGVKARYVRLYSNGCTANEMNNYVEIEVFGIPAQ
jgi:hypothetical protein